MGRELDRRSFLKKWLLCSLFGGMGSHLLSAFTQSKEIEPPFDGEALFYERSGDNAVQCQLCFRRCLIPEGGRGFCRNRENRAGILRSLVYGRPSGLQIDPIELEPMYHMVPGHRNLCVYTASCNFRCKHCHNWPISQSAPEQIRALRYTPKEIVEEALRHECRSISHSINEPTVFYELMYGVVQEAKKKGLLTLCHTNGGMRKAPLLELLKFMDGVTVDLKAFSQKFYREISESRLEPVLETLKTIKGANKHLEIVNLIIPTLNDQMDDIEKMCRWIVGNLGKNTPLHFTRFSPSYKMTHLPFTPINILEEARSIAMGQGIEYVYIGNVVGHPANSTYCPKCHKTLIERTHFIVLRNHVKDGLCPFCKEKIPGIWKR
ncbi:MAG: AmmeMemoRadiSam system radical SAM enzyme [Proteobacteria bacterium]|nr:AmmeMemoRadiSam system radical SAM enzyme [Pseudomonadota bacterium]